MGISAEGREEFDVRRSTFDVKNGSYGSYGNDGSYEELFPGPIIPILNFEL
jgi:hypothetical protein